MDLFRSPMLAGVGRIRMRAGRLLDFGTVSKGKWDGGSEVKQSLEGNSHIHEMHLSILEVILSQPNANWQDSFSLDTIAPTPQPWHRRALLMKCVGRRRWDGIAQIDKSHKSSCKHRALHLEAIELCVLRRKLRACRAHNIFGSLGLL
jgi:hypothetical protein